ncbi:MAG: carboxypeptidase-like regulatory domain-containing protein, partial [Bacteroides sp.]
MSTSLMMLLAGNGWAVSSELGGSRNESSTAVVQQNKTIKGTVVDQNGEPVIGANVIVKGSATGTITDIDGKFSLSIPANAILEVSYI